MELTDRLYEEVKDIWAGYLEHPFVKGIGDGSLPIERFRSYMIQDYLYLLDYAKVFALGVVKAADEDVMRFFARNVKSVLDDEMAIHKTYMSRLGITKKEMEQTEVALDNKSYTSYMLAVAHQEDVLGILLTILACAWSYQVIGQEFIKRSESAEHEFYGEWIQGYGSQAYADQNQELFDMVNRLGKNCSEKEYDTLKEIFVRCSLYEAKFWDIA